MNASGGLLHDVSVSFDPVGSWAALATVTAALALVLFAVGPDRTRVTAGRRLALVGIRMAAFLALVACMLRPTIVATKQARQPGTVLVLADASESMTVADGLNGQTRWQELVAALGVARPAARALVSETNLDVALWRFDREARSVPPQDDDPFPLGAWQAGPTAGETAIGAALDDGLRALAGRSIAGVIVLSDGAQHAYPPRDQPPQNVARRLADAGVPLWSITFGQQRGEGQGRDAAVSNLAVSETAYLGNAVEVAGRVRLEGLADRDVVVKLLVEGAAGRLEEAARTVVRGGREGVEEAVRLTWTPRDVGERKLVMVVESQEGETVTTNNELSTFVEVVDGGLRVLYLEGALRVEQRFLRRVLSASPDMQVDFQWIDSTRRDRWPIDLERTLASDHDVFLIGDLDAAALRPRDLETILGKVREGAGIGLLGGFHAFEAGGWASSALGPLMPFAPDRLARQPFDQPIRPSLHLEGPLQVVPDARFGGVSILRLGQTDAETRAAWQRMPALDGANDLGRLVPEAKSLAGTADGRPLLVARDFGTGRVAAFAADSTWRWAMQGAGEQHRRFWRQFVLWLARRDGTEADSLWVRLGQRRIAPGMTISCDAGMTKPDGTAVADVEIDAVAVSPEGRPRPVRLPRRGEGFSGMLADFAEPGDWKLVVKASRPGLPPVERAARFTVVRQDLELANPRANPLLMRQLAESTAGGTRAPEELPEIFDEIRNQPAAFETLEQWSATPWDSWPAFLVMVGLLILEWILRKRFGLV
ncbi:MAG: hypothetical protein EBS56_04610 [Planctomycetia bacterium]|nr:hypothetical protein [Planctomycetia bacterium]